MNKMLGLLLLSLLCFSCVMIDEEPSHIEYNPFPGRDDLGVATVRLPGQASTNITSQEAAAACDVYEVLVYNNQRLSEPVMLSFIAAPGEVLDISLPVDIYKIIVLAGVKYKKNNYTMENILVGSGFADYVSVQLNQVTDVVIQLKQIEIKLNVPEVVYLDDISEYTYTSNTFNSILEIGPANFLGFDKDGNNVMVQSLSSCISSPGVFCFEVEFFPEPQEPTEWDVYMVPEYVIFYDRDNWLIEYEINALTAGVWKFPYASALSTEPIPPVPFEKMIHKHISFQAKQGINVTIEW